MKCFRAASTKKTAFLAQKNGQKMPVFGLKQCLWGLRGRMSGLPPYFEGAGLKKNVFRQVLAQVVECFGAAITKKTPFFAEKWPKKPFFSFKQCFWGLSGQL